MTTTCISPARLRRRGHVVHDRDVGRVLVERAGYSSGGSRRVISRASQSGSAFERVSAAWSWCWRAALTVQNATLCLVHGVGRDQLPEAIRELVLDDQRSRNGLCWSAFDG
jgi:hypothetical protein